jgi:hypothetical protein
MTSPSLADDCTAPYLRDTQVFPHLTSEMIARLERYGAIENVECGTFLFRRGQRTTDFFAVRDGSIGMLGGNPGDAPFAHTAPGSSPASWTFRRAPSSRVSQDTDVFRTPLHPARRGAGCIDSRTRHRRNRNARAHSAPGRADPSCQRRRGPRRRQTVSAGADGARRAGRN